jgi:hypothetical protein
MSARSDVTTGSIRMKSGINMGNAVPQNEFFRFCQEGSSPKFGVKEYLLFAKKRH